MIDADPYELRGDVFVAPVPVHHREAEYDSSGFDLLAVMQRHHFWYHGRHRFLLDALRRHCQGVLEPRSSVRAVDLGGGCGGWIDYLFRNGIDLHFAELALADSADLALHRARQTLGPSVPLFKADLLNLQWIDRWDVAFLLDVIEHLPDDAAALSQVAAALAPGGLAFVTVPALQVFWSRNDEWAGHQRRYRRADFPRLAAASGLELLEVRYFMFLLSPILFATRAFAGLAQRSVQRDRRAWLARTHRVPPPLVNRVLGRIFGAETPIGHVVRFPWGTSLLAVLRKRCPVHGGSEARA
jgi:SAM-dependent methyltransferase